MRTSSTIRVRRLRRFRRRGQAAVETMMLAFMVMVILVCMVHLFSVTWASENAHMRAREGVLHRTTYLQGKRAGTDFIVPGADSPWDSATSNYRVAESGAQPFRFQADAYDTTMDDMIGSQDIWVTATIVGN